MRLVVLTVLLLSFGQAVPARAESRSATQDERGVYSGSGRACAGILVITADHISWSTPFSYCAATAFTVKDRTKTNKSLRVAYQLLRSGGKCRYQILMLTHDGDNKGIGWNVVGFPSLTTYNPEKPETGLSCYLVK
jgi:hypothetical protein